MLHPRRRPFLAACLLAALPSAAAAQRELPRPTPRLIKRSDWAATPLWRARLEASESRAVAEVKVLRRLADGLILLVREEPMGVQGAVVAQHVRLERRDGAGHVLWQQSVPGLPSRFGTFHTEYLAGTGTQRSLLVATFLPGDNRRAALYGRMIEVDETAGRLRALGGVARPRTRREWIEDEVFEIHGALRLDDDRLALYGGFGTGPYNWWVGLLRLDGTLLWQAMNHTAAGGVRSLRAVPGGFDASVYVIMAWPNESNVGTFRMRFDDTGKMVGSMKMAAEGVMLFAPDGSAATTSEAQPPTLIVEDRYGRRRTLAALPAHAHLRYHLDDGSFVLFDKGDHDLVVSADGRAAFHIERDIRYETILADGGIFAATCTDDDCRVRELALCRRPW